ncbi:alpha/beta hydrolase [Salmonirosea aquatica]|uniref:Serine aminopeptidase S33 domain-containing protein n=1 Tax=Salmonirosea aquatica TaxID=2654236 RepID=A0A7C9BCX6_9BACT|nr:hypothetical protein [Cytophagaceae bacterium SJW1-29]
MNRLLLAFFFFVPSIASALPPEREYWITPDSLGLDYVQKELVTPDGARLLSWSLPTKSSEPLHKTLLITNATTGNMANMLHYAKAFLAAGFDVVLFDYRGFGHSSDFPKDPAYLYYNEYVTDMETAIVAAKKQFPENQLGILSFSASTILATLAVQKRPVDFIIGEGYVRDPSRIIEIWKVMDPSLKLVLPAGAEGYVQATRRIPCPMLLMTGTQDDITPPADVRAVADMRPNRTFLLYEGHHLQATIVWEENEFADGYVRRIREFVTSLR